MTRTFEPAAKPTLEAVLDHYGVRYRQTRSGQKILCPVHPDRKPSCSLDLGRALWNCQSCPAGGDSWALIQAMEGDCDFKRAVELADKLGLPRVDDAPTEVGRRQPRGTSRRSSLIQGTVAHHGEPPSGYVPSWKR